MNPHDLLDDLAENSGRLRAAMHSSNADAIEKAMEDFRGALEKIQAVGSWDVDPTLKDKIAGLIPEMEQSRMLACLLSDMVGQLHEKTAARTLDARQPVYRRDGARYA